jgi:hypothetical protein
MARNQHTMCCSREEPDGAPLGPSEKGRKCTDVLLLVLFGVFNVGMIALMAYSLAEGDFRRVTHPVNYLGCACCG